MDSNDKQALALVAVGVVLVVVFSSVLVPVIIAAALIAWMRMAP